MKIAKEDKLPFLLMLITAAAVLIMAIIFRQNFFYTLPLFISMVVSFLHSRANSYAYLIGGLNSVLYAIVYLVYGVYAQALQCLIFSLPLQIMTFIRWNRHSYKHTTEFRSLSKKQLLFTGLGFLAIWGTLYVVLTIMGSNYIFIDITSTLIGILATFLSLFAFVEYAFGLFLSNVLALILHISMTIDSPEQITYVVFSIYAVFCSCKEVLFVGNTLKEQRAIIGDKKS